MKNKKILITGGAGFLGTNLAENLLKREAKVIIVDNLSRRGSELNIKKLINEFGKKIKFYKVDLSDISHVIHKEKPSLIYHFAAQVAVTSSVDSPADDFRVNAEGTFLVAHTASLYDIPVIYSSTNKVYGDNVNNVPIKEYKTRYDFSGDLKGFGVDENFSIDSRKHTPYGCSKLAGELYVREFGGVVNRCSCMYGPNQYGIVDQGWVSYFINRKLTDGKITIFGDGKQIRDLLYIDDVVSLLIIQGRNLLSGKKELRGEVFSIGGGHENTISLIELCDILDLEMEFSDWRPSDQKVYYADISKAEKILGWKPKISSKEGIKKLLDWSKLEKDK